MKVPFMTLLLLSSTHSNLDDSDETKLDGLSNYHFCGNTSYNYTHISWSGMFSSKYVSRTR